MKSIKDWEILRKTNPTKWIKEYRRFMYNPDNIGSCEKCPENRGFKNCPYPCGQYHCWVKMSCK